MGKVIVLISTTLDGFADAENVIVDPGFFEFTHSLMNTAAIAAFGRNTFEVFQERWPQRLNDKSAPEWIRKMAQSLHDIPKVVFSSTLKKTAWHNSTIVSDLNSDYVKAFKERNKGSFLTFGSVSLIEQLTAMNLVDEYYFNVQPVLPGRGDVRLFNKLNLKATIPLKFIDSTNQISGAHVIHYTRGDASALGN